MVKVFVGNLPREAKESEIRALFEEYGKVVEFDIIKNYGFVHFEKKSAADEAVRKLHHHRIHGVTINVELSKSKAKASTKLHVSHLSTSCTNQELRAKFEEYGSVLECDIVKDYAFVHMERAEDAIEAIKGLDNTEFKGKRMHVQLSTSRLRSTPGMGETSGCYRCGREGHWSKECPIDRTGRGPEFPDNFAEQFAPLRAPEPYPPVRAPSYPSAYTDRLYYDDRDRYGVVDYYQRYRAGAYSAAALDPYADRRLPPMPPMSSTSLRDTLSASLDYERRLVSAPSTSYTASYFGRDRSPLRRTSAVSTTLGNGYAYERTRLSPVSSVSRSAIYDLPRYGREAYTERSRYTAY
ncbi:RNA-binding protein 4-like isoform X1 [Lissotriton helveticus]